MESKNYIRLYSISNFENKDMANGMRDMSRTPLTDTEIEFVKAKIHEIEADESVFVFNDVAHISKSTCYSTKDDKIYVTRNVFPDDKFGSTHPRDLMSVKAVLAHEYYGHRTFREEYLKDINCGEITTPEWKDECRASITAAKITPNLSDLDKSYLVLDAIYRAKEYGHLIEMDGFMKEVVYGYTNDEKHISRGLTEINYIREESDGRVEHRNENYGHMPHVRRITDDYEEPER